MKWITLSSLVVVWAAALGASMARPASSASGAKTLKVISWNVLYGFDHQRAVDKGAGWIKAQGADVLALQELNGFTHEGLQRAAAQWGHGHSALQKESGFALGLTSTAPIEILERRTEGFHHGFLHCRTHGVHYLVVHFWPGKEHELDTVLAKARALVAEGARVIVLGDFNAHSRRDEAFLATKRIEPRYGLVDSTEAAGFVDVIHRHDRRALYSCPSPITIPRWSKDLAELDSKRQRIDFIFADERLGELSSAGTIVRSAPLEAISDHYPLVAEFSLLPPEWPVDPPEMSFGVVADCQYCAAEARGQRFYAESAAKLDACVEHLAGLDLSYVIHLGDLIDRDYESFDVVLPIFERLACPRHQVLGNHDYEVADELKANVPKRLGMPGNYYDFAVEGWRFVVLDGNDISRHAHAKGSAGRQAALEYQAKFAPSAPTWNGAMGPAQLKWLEEVLLRAGEAGERVILYSHFPVFPEDAHNLWNAADVLELVDRSPCVKAYINGHNHAGKYGVRDGVHFLTLKGMVDTHVSSYAVIEVHAEHLRVRGFGRETDRLLTIR